MAITTPVVTGAETALATPTTTSQALTGILNKGGALMQQAATAGNQSAAARGLLNSSMGVQAAQSSVLQAATPIAQADAQALTQTSQFNAQNTNAQNQFNAGQQNEALFKALDVNSREQLANIEAQYKTQMQTSASADALYSQVMKNISDIQMSDSVSDKQAAIDSQLAWLRSGMQMVENLNGVTGLVTF